MSVKKEIAYHIIFWTAFVVLDQFLESIMRSHQLSWFWNFLQTLGFVILQMIVFYINYLWVCPATIPKKRWVLFGLAQIVLVFLFPALRYLAEEVILFHITGAHNYSTDGLNIPYYVYDNSYFVARILLLSIVGYFLKYLWNTNQELNTLQLEKKQAELQVLKNQLSPHFLFNTLNSFYSELYETQPKVADDIIKLSEMLRFITYENESDKVLLKDDITFIQNYIDLFNRRFDGNIAVLFRYPDYLLHYTIPSLLLIHFVENAFKHGVLDDKNCPVTIAAEIEGERLLFSVTNCYRKGQHYDEAGIGQKNITQRLSIMYPNDHVLKVDRHDNMYHVILNIPLSR